MNAALDANASAATPEAGYGNVMPPFDPSPYWTPSGGQAQNGAGGILPAEHPSTSSAPSMNSIPPPPAIFLPGGGAEQQMFSQQQQQNFDPQQQHYRQLQQQQQQMRLQQQQFIANGGDPEAFQHYHQQQQMMIQHHQQQQQQRAQQQQQQQQQANMHSPMFSPPTPQQQQQQNNNCASSNNNSNNMNNNMGDFVSPTNGTMTPNFASPGGGAQMNGGAPAPGARLNMSPLKNGWAGPPQGLQGPQGLPAGGLTPQQQMQFQQQQQMHFIEQQRRNMMNGNAGPGAAGAAGPGPMMGPAAAAAAMMANGVRPRMPSALLFTSDMANQAARDVKEAKKYDNMLSWHFANCPPSTSAAPMQGIVPPNGMMHAGISPGAAGFPAGVYPPQGMTAAPPTRSPMDGTAADYGAYNNPAGAAAVNGSASPATTGTPGAATPGAASSRGTKRKASVQAANSTPSPSLVHSMGGVGLDGSGGPYGGRMTPATGDGRNSVSSTGAAGGMFLSPKSEADDPLKRIEMMTKQHMDQPPSAKIGRSDSATPTASSTAAAAASKTPTSTSASLLNRDQKLARLSEIRQNLNIPEEGSIDGIGGVGGFPPGVHPMGSGMMNAGGFKPGGPQLSLEQQQMMMRHQHAAFLAQQQQQQQMATGGGMMPPPFSGPMPPGPAAGMMPGGGGSMPSMDGMPPNPSMMMMMGDPNGVPFNGMNNGQMPPMNQRILQYRMFMHEQQQQQQRLMGQPPNSGGAVNNTTPTSAAGTSMNGGEPFGGPLPMDPTQSNGMMGMWPSGQHPMPQSLTNLDARVPVQKMQYYAPASGGDA